jgi:hypothetical protein
VIEPRVDLKSLNAFLNRLASAGAHYTIRKVRPEAFMVLVATPAERWEVEFMTEDWGRVEVERYGRLGQVAGAEALTELWDRLGLPAVAVPARPEVNSFVNTLERSSFFYELFKRDPKGLTVRVDGLGQYWEATFLDDGYLAVERFESPGEIEDEGALKGLWDSLQTEADHP